MNCTKSSPNMFKHLINLLPITLLELSFLDKAHVKLLLLSAASISPSLKMCWS